MISDDQEIDEQHIIFSNNASIESMLDDEATMEEYNKRILQYYLNKYDQNVVQVAEKLQIGKSTIYRMLKEGKL